LRKKPGHKPSESFKPKENIQEKVERYLKRFTSPKDRDYFRIFILEMIENKTIPMELIEQIPISAANAGKTRFDQLYDAVMSIVFPGYRQETLYRMLGPSAEIRKNTKLWRAIFPERFGISHIFLRADSYQQAFALSCDYACRVSLRLYRRIPHDLTIRVMFISEKATRRKLDMRWANRVAKRKELQLVGRKFTPKEITGARLAALGHPSDPSFSVAKYAEEKDLLKVLHEKTKIRFSEVESENFKKDR
jgi:hypothetical protein